MLKMRFQPHLCTKKVMKEDIKEAAQALFMAHYTQKAIANLLGVTEQTLTAWAKKEQWDESRVREKFDDEHRIKDVKTILDYTLQREVAMIRESQEGLKSGKIKAKDAYITSPVVGRMIAQLSAYTKKEEAGFFQTTTIITEFINHIAENSPDTAHQISGFAETFIKKKIKKS
jgi:DNA-binding XRE family transcriptional regulator